MAHDPTATEASPTAIEVNARPDQFRQSAIVILKTRLLGGPIVVHPDRDKRK
jgi:hypothetical protein